MNDKNKVYDIIKPFHRLNPLPLDRSSLFTDFDTAEYYAETDKSAYLGQVVSVVDAEERMVTVYKIVYSGDTEVKTLARVDDMSFQKIEELREELVTVIETRIAELESGMTELEYHITEVIESGLTDHEERIAILESGQSDHEERIIALESGQTDHEVRIGGLEDRVTANEEKTDENSRRIDDIIVSVQENDPLVTKHGDINGNDMYGRRMSEVFEDVSDALSGITDDITDIRDRIDALPGTTYSKDEIDTKFSDKDAELETIFQVISEALNDLNLRVRNNALDIADDIAEISATTETVLAKIAEIEETIENIQPGVDPATREELQEIKDALSALTEDVIYNAENISGLTEEIDVIGSELNVVSEDLDVLKGIVEGLANKIGSEDAFSATTIEDEIRQIKEALAGAGTGTLKNILVNNENIVNGDTATLNIVGDGDIFVEKDGDTVTIGVLGISNEPVTL